MFNATSGLSQTTNGTTPIKNTGPIDIDFDREPGLVFVMIASLCASLWLFYITFYNARVLGFILTKLLSRFFVKEGYLSVGSFSFSILSGKLMFRDVKYITKDYSVRIVDGFCIFKWWLQYDPTEHESADYRVLYSQDEDAPGCRLTIDLNRFELALYNRSALYNRLQDIFKTERYGDAGKSIASLNMALAEDVESTRQTMQKEGFQWRELIPAVKININTGRIAVGNKLVETTLWVNFDSGSAVYSTIPAASTLDEFSHIVKCQCEDVRVLLSPSAGYPGPKTEPPRFMGEGFVVLQSGAATLTYYQDEPGNEPENAQDSPDSDPHWGLDVIFTKNTTMTYGPWADKQREYLQKFFFPQDYQEQPVTKPLSPGQKRSHTGFDLKILFQMGANIEFIFSKDQETSAVHFCTGPGSSLHFYQPWNVNEYGYTSNMLLQLKSVEISTSLDFRRFVVSDTLEVEVNMTIPRIWNQFQHWTCELWLTKSTLFFIFEHKEFLQDLINDWAVTEPADVAFFVPYEWELKFNFRDFEMIWLMNQHNWIDCTNDNENSQIAFCGESLEVSFTLPFTKFLPEVEEIRFFIMAESLVLRSFLHESNTLRKSVLSLARNSDRRQYPRMERVFSMASDPPLEQETSDENQDETDRGGNPDEELSQGWRRNTDLHHGWFDVWSVPFACLSIFYRYHPMHILSENTEAINKRLGFDYSRVQPSSLKPDVLTVEFEAGPSALRLFGSFLKQFMTGFKENYFGVSQKPIEFNAVRELARDITALLPEKTTKSEDPRAHRPFEANIIVKLVDMQAELSKHCNNMDPASPVAYLDSLSFEMHKTFRETRMQLILSPITIFAADSVKRHNDHAHLSRGFLSLSGLQFRGHAMFSDKGIPVGEDTLEYAWLTEIQCGTFTGKVTLPQLQSVLCWGETFILHCLDEENELKPPTLDVRCQHGALQKTCEEFSKLKDGNASKRIKRLPSSCFTEADLKYRMTRISVEQIDLFVVETECACNVKASPIRFSTCSSHSDGVTEGTSLFINDILVRQYIQHMAGNQDISGAVGDKSPPAHSNNWLEVAVVTVGPVTADVVGVSHDEFHQEQQWFFLRLHDRLTKRLWFLWSPEELSGRLQANRSKHSICGCVGGCNFFGKNINGVRFFTISVLDAGEAKFGRYGSESLWGDTLERRSSLRDRFLTKSRVLSTLSMSGSPNAFRQRSDVHHYRSSSLTVRKAGRADSEADRVRSSSVMRSSSVYKPGTESKIGLDRSRLISIGGSRLSVQKISRTESEATFYSCESDLEGTLIAEDNDEEELKKTESMSNLSMKSGSTGSYVSAVASKEDLNEFDLTDGPMKFKPLVPPDLMSIYSQNLHQVSCMNWRQSVPSGYTKNFSILKNLKTLRAPGHRLGTPSTPNFKPMELCKLPFVVISKPTSTGSKETGTEEPPLANAFQPDLKRPSRRASTGSVEDLETDEVAIQLKIHHQVNAVISPLLLQALERYVDSLKRQQAMQPPAYLIDALHLTCISLSKQEYQKREILAVLEPRLKNEVLPSSLKGDNRKLFRREKLTMSATAARVNIIAFQVSADTYSPSEQSSLSGQRGSECSLSWGVMSDSPAVLFASAISDIRASYTMTGDNTNMRKGKHALLRKYNRVGTRESPEILGQLYKRSQPDVSGGTVMISKVELQIQRLNCLPDRLNSITSIPPDKSAVSFNVHRGGDVDVEELTWLEPRPGDPVGFIMLECGVNRINGKLLSYSSIEREDRSSQDSWSITCRTRTLSSSTKYSTVRKDGSGEGKSEVGSPVETKDSADSASPIFCRDEPIADSEPKRLAPKTPEQSGLSGSVGLYDLDSDGVDFEQDTAENQALLKPPGKPVRESNSSESREGKEESRKDDEEAIELVVMPTKEEMATSKEDVAYGVLNEKKGHVELASVWFDLAAPQRLKVIQEGVDEDVNLVTTLVPASCSWIPVSVDLQRTIYGVMRDRKKWGYTVLACLLGQALPEHGRLLKKHNITTICTNLSHFLQEEYSSQLIYVLRRHLIGSRLSKLMSALEDRDAIPKCHMLEKGIHALARQWKCVLIGAEANETIFATARPTNRKHVVGRGVLTTKDLAILLQDSVTEKNLTGVTSPVPRPPTPEPPSSPNVISENEEEMVTGSNSNLASAVVRQLSEAILEESDSSDGSMASVNSEGLLRQRKGREGDSGKPQPEEENLYNWLSNAGSPVHSGGDRENETGPGNSDKPRSPVSQQDLASANADLFRSTSPMVSVPTSGMQLAEAREVFSAILTAIGMETGVQYSPNLHSLSTLNFGLQSLSIYIVKSRDHAYKEMDNCAADVEGLQTSGKGSPAFLLQHFTIHGIERYHSRRDGLSPLYQSALQSNTCGAAAEPREITFVVSLGIITQYVNIGLVRFVMQISETMDMIKEEKRFAQKIKSMEMIGLGKFDNIDDISPSKTDTELPKSWRTMYNVLDLYTVTSSTVNLKEIPAEGGKSPPVLRPGQRSIHKPKEVRIDVLEESLSSKQSTADRKKPGHHSRTRGAFFPVEWVTVYSMAGVVELKEVTMLASLCGMSLEARLDQLNTSVVQKKNVLRQKWEITSTAHKDTLEQKESQMQSISGHVNGIKMTIVESGRPFRQTLTVAKLEKSHALYSSRIPPCSKQEERLTMVLGLLIIDVPQHPGILRSVAARFTRRLQKHFIEVDNYRASRRMFKHPAKEIPTDQSSVRESVLPDHVAMCYHVILKGVNIHAALLPSLRAEYKIGEVSGRANQGPKARFRVQMLEHSFHFSSKMSPIGFSSFGNTMSVDLPPVTLEGSYMVLMVPSESHMTSPQSDENEAHYVHSRFCAHGYLRAVADIGSLQQSLTTDLLNHLIFLQKGFLKEVNEVISDVEEEEPVPLWGASSPTSIQDEPVAAPLLYSIQVNLKGIQLTATTPSAMAVRLHTGVVAMEISNRSPTKNTREEPFPRSSSYMKLFGKAQVDLTFSLGQFKARFHESDQEFQQFAYFRTRIGLRNALQEKPILHHSHDKETVIITLSKPQIYIMPLAVDKGVLVYLHYKNAYDHWNEQISEVQATAQHLLDRLPPRTPQPQLSGSLFLQLNVDELGICVPLQESASAQVTSGGSFSATPVSSESEPGAALVVTVEETSIMCCSSGSFVSRGLFRNFCLRFADRFDYQAEAWLFDCDEVMNTCSVPEGSYELCSKTQLNQPDTEPLQPGKWVMSVVWKMCGVDINIDANIGKRLSALGHALTAITGDFDVADLSSVADVDDPDNDTAFADSEDNTTVDYDMVDYHDNEASKVFDDRELLSPSGPHTLERQLWEQTRRVNELKRTNATQEQLGKEVRILQEIEAALSNEFFRDVRKRFRRRSRKGTYAYGDRMRSPTGRRHFLPLGSESPSILQRRHSSVDHYLEAKQLERAQPGPVQTSKRKSADIESRMKWERSQESRMLVVQDSIDGPESDSLGFNSDPTLFLIPGNEKKMEAKESERSAKVDSLSSPRVTFSESCNDVRSTASQRYGSSAPLTLDFELDVVVDIDSGKCILHTGTEKEKEEDGGPILMRGDSNLSNDAKRRVSDGAETPVATSSEVRKDRYSGSDIPSGITFRPFIRRIRSNLSQPAMTSVSEDTVILVPGLNVRVHYESTTASDKQSGKGSGVSSTGSGQSGDSTEALEVSPSTAGSSLGQKANQKSAGLYAWFSFQPLAREMILRPSLLDFLDKALKPLVVQPNTPEDSLSDASGSVMSEAEPNGNGSLVSSSTSEHTSFPVDVTIYIRVQPSDVRLSCLPISKVECLLRIPSLDFIISSTSSPNKHLEIKKGVPLSPKKLKTTSNNAKLKPSPLNQEVVEFDSGGLSFSVCLSRFSFCIFHPYGKQYGSTSDARSFVETGLYPGKRKNRGMVAQPISGRKDSLSLNLEFIKFNLFRRRLKTSASNLRSRKLSASSDCETKTVVKVSAICDIGSAAFNYDMRRLNEILDVPKAWYKRELFRRMFLGKEGAYATKSTVTPQAMNTTLDSSTPTTDSPLLPPRLQHLDRGVKDNESTPRKPRAIPRRSNAHRRALSGSGFLGNIVGSPGFFLNRSATVGSRSDLPTNVEATSRTKDCRNNTSDSFSLHSSSDEVDGHSSSVPSDSRPCGEWETQVAIALDLSRMDVSTNMGSVLGQAIWSTTDLRAHSRLLINNTGNKTFRAKVSVRQGSFDAHGGIIGGFAEVQDIIASGNFDENLGTLPSHTVKLGLKSGEVRIDYMGTCILMATLNGFTARVKDSWVLPHGGKTTRERRSRTIPILQKNGSDPLLKPEPLSTEVRLHGEADVNEFQMIISRSTTPDIVKMVSKLEEFLTQQHRSSLHALSSFRPLSDMPNDPVSALRQSRQKATLTGEKEGEAEKVAEHNDGLKYQHWVEILNAVSGMELNNLSCPIPDRGVVVGGKLIVKATYVSLGCFHGSNFRAQNWALFSIREPVARFSTNTWRVEKSCQIKRASNCQELYFSLGHEMEGRESSRSPTFQEFMATVRKVSRGRRNPPSMGAQVHEWLAYVNTTNDDDLPAESPDNGQKSPTEKFSLLKQTTGSRKVSFAPKIRYENDSEVIFALPKLSVKLKTEHDQPMTLRLAKILSPHRLPFSDPWLSTLPSPHVVDCTFVSFFDDSLCVTMDVSLLFFLHDLTLAYMKEKESVISGSSSRTYRSSKGSDQKDSSPPQTSPIPSTTAPPPSGPVPKSDESSSSGKKLNKVDTLPKDKYRQFRCKSWKLEPRIRLLSWAGKRMDPVGIDWVLEKLGFTHADLTIPKWIQRGAMDPMDYLLSILVAHMIAGMRHPEEKDDE